MMEVKTITKITVLTKTIIYLTMVKIKHMIARHIKMVKINTMVTGGWQKQDSK